ncbi:Ribosomal small subunit pseudouridine synthase A [BD1-7 clade bacterium]|uniref:Pseudouridine synthase n=1 Tax=BD1-7 clade bacterium TaxID=2029982 RepID=A0A5S9QQG3_9GAMM|nr:Ribosomal small subunit pseudouridine synthase A [BD1-7 clade bacterium]CAA0120843.1 Ribosomal small subunit pseudouridine synthase A [BD1-7 clade bacterium]
MRLDKFICHAKGITRSECKRLLHRGMVTVNQEIVKNPGLKVSSSDDVVLSGASIQRFEDIYILLHKPPGYVCSHLDDGAPSALNLLPESFDAFKAKLSFAGRLDADTTGLVLLSTDGQWVHRVTSPKQKRSKSKQYRVTLARSLLDAEARAVESGLILKGEPTPTRPCVITLHSDTQCDIELSEGRYHQVRRMFAAVGNHVDALHRFAMGNIRLDDSINPGAHRPLTQQEIEFFNND